MSRWQRMVAAAALGALPLVGESALASSHREAPFITELPKVDSTDFYMFRSYEEGREGYVTLIANYQPFQDAYGGPNYFVMDPDALYEIHIDNDGDAREDLTFQFRFRNSINGENGLTVPVGGKDVNIAFPALGPITDDASRGANQHVIETYTVKVAREGRRSAAQDVTRTGGATTFAKPFDNIGTKTFPNYEAYANTFVHTVNVPGCQGTGKVFVGQRKESFAVNVGVLFDLLNVPDFTAILDPANRGAFPNPLEDKNITTIALELPIACLTASADKPIIGGWQTASLRQARVLNPRATYNVPAREGGAWTQVSRLGMPLVNEVIIGLKDKNLFNSSEPREDAQFLDYVTNPTLPALVQTLTAGALTAPATPRNDLVAAFLTGVPGVNANGATAEYQRLNTSVPPTPAAKQNSLGAVGCFDAQKQVDLTAAGCDAAGFPNGRRPGDDVTDIELTVAMGYLVPGALPAGVVVHDGVLQEAAQFDASFPYLRPPLPGAGGASTTPQTRN
jgi:hypothetical protein